MNIIKMMWKNKKTRIWLLVFFPVVILLLVVALVVTQVPLIDGTLDIVFGGDRPILGEDGGTVFEGNYSTKTEALEAANSFNETIVEEGITLLKNDDNALPIASSSKVTVFGKNSVNLVYGGSGSAAGNNTGEKKTLYDSLTAAGIEYNPTMKEFYESNNSGSSRPSNPAMGSIISGFAIGESPASSYSRVRDSYSSYNDAAIVVISRIGGEGFDLPRTMKNSYENGGLVDGAMNEDDHYLELDKNEVDMLTEACSNFEKVIVVLNTSTSMELGFLDDPQYKGYNEKIKACLWVGLPGNSGAMALGRVLTGEVNPSGRTTDIYARDFTLDPSYKNFGNNNTTEGNGYLLDGNASGYYFVDYEEGIYVGYRYYETRDVEERKDNPSSTWYKDNVVYPFGYGLSYSAFDWNIANVSISDGSTIVGTSEIEITVDVTNNSEVAGKDVVELYYSAPYYENGIEKSEVVLVAFGKTELIPAHETRSVTLSFTGRDMASYDYDDANGNGFVGYELEHGTYDVTLRRNSHDVVDTLTYTVAADEKYDKDDVTGTTIENLFDDVSDGLDQEMSRADFEGTFPTTPTITDRTVDADFISSLTYRTNDEGKPWYTDDMPTYSDHDLSAEEVTVTLNQLSGLDYDDPLWDTFLDQMSLSQMSNLIGTGAFGTIGITELKIPITYNPDGPSGFANFMSSGGPVFDTCFYAAEIVIASTWNVELAEDFGRMVGDEALVGDTNLPYAGWNAPAMNIHRSPFAGRNWEYYSEDPILSGEIAAAVVRGCNEKGVTTYLKHFAVNDQETNRDSNGILVWVSEQAMREIYLKPFEISVKKGGTRGIMTSFNRLGTIWAGGHYNLLTKLLREEWGFVGAVVTDYSLPRYMNVNQQIRAGGDIVFNQGDKAPSSNYTATQVTCMRKACHNILYVVANSNAMVDIVGYNMPYWKMILIIVESLIFAGLVAWGVAVITIEVKKNRKKEEN